MFMISQCRIVAGDTCCVGEIINMSTSCSLQSIDVNATAELSSATPQSTAHNNENVKTLYSADSTAMTSSYSLHSVEPLKHSCKTYNAGFTKMNCSFEISQSEVAGFYPQLQNSFLNDRKIKLVANEINICKVAPVQKLPEIKEHDDGDCKQNTKAKVNCTIDMPNSITTAVCDQWKKDSKCHIEIDIYIPSIESTNVCVSVTDSGIYGAANLSLYINKMPRLENSAVGTEAIQSLINFNYPEDNSKNGTHRTLSNTQTDISHTMPVIEIISMDNIRAIPQSTSNKYTHVPKTGTSLPEKSSLLSYTDNFDSKRHHVYSTQPHKSSGFPMTQAAISSSSSTFVDPKIVSVNRSDVDQNKTCWLDCLYICCSLCSELPDLVECLLCSSDCCE